MKPKYYYFRAKYHLETLLENIILNLVEFGFFKVKDIGKSSQYFAVVIMHLNCNGIIGNTIIFLCPIYINVIYLLRNRYVISVSENKH